MGTRNPLSRSLFSAALGLCLLSLVFLGSPGCGCGDDDLPVNEGGPGRCCCTFEWLPPRIANGDDVVITIENMDTSLDGVVTPALLTSVSFTTPETFTVCVNDEHVLSDSLELVFSDQVTNEEYGRAGLIYKTRCRPAIAPLSDGLNLTSTDCGGGGPLRCCCEFEWRPGPNMVGDVTIAAENVSAGLNPVITPAALTGVSPEAIELIDVCVDADHPLGAQMDLVIRQQGSGVIMGVAQLLYDEICSPTIVPTTAFPGLDITSTECGGAPLTCCCNFEWLPPVDYTGNVNITAVNPSTGLEVQITPSTINGVVPRTFYNFDVCVNADQILPANFELVITDSGGGEIGRALVSYDIRCDADITDIAGVPGLFLTTTDCGGETLLCCCDFIWTIGDPDSNLTGVSWTAALESVDTSLQVATLTPTSGTIGTPIWTETFTICVNPTHSTLATLDLVIRDAAGAELARLPLLYDLPCLPVIGDPSGAGLWTNLCETVNKPGR